MCTKGYVYVLIILMGFYNREANSAAFVIKIITPFLDSRISANHDKGEEF